MSSMPSDADINADIGRALRMRRRTMGLTQRAVADAIGVTWVQLHKYEHGAAGVSAERLQRLAVVLRCSPGDLLGEPDPYEHPGARRLVAAWSRLAAPEQRQAVLNLLEALGASGRGQLSLRSAAGTPAEQDARPDF